MKPLLHLVGRAWHFVSKHMPEENFIINHGYEVPTFLEEAQQQLRTRGKLEVRIRDIDSCYPNMPKTEIRQALIDTTKKIQKQLDVDGVWVPKRSTLQPCKWSRGRSKKEMVFIPFKEMIDVVNFSLENTFVKMPDGKILKQDKGIPMGDPTSPGITIITCAWMEAKFIKQIPEQEKQNIRARRYMDDLLVLVARNNTKQQDEILEQLDDGCYADLKLVPGKENTFLENTIKVNDDNSLEWWLKDDNKEQPNKIWRYTLVDSQAPYKQKVATIKATLKKAYKMGSNDSLRFMAIRRKLVEFRLLGFTASSLKQICKRLAIETDTKMWFDLPRYFF